MKLGSWPSAPGFDSLALEIHPRYYRAMNISGCQMDCVWEDKDASFARVDSLLQLQPPAPGGFIVLPEMFATGFSRNLAKTGQGPGRECDGFLARIARQYRCAVLGGVVGTSTTGRYCNQAVAIGPDGEEIARYSKIQPFSAGGELEVHEPGREIVTFRWGGFTVAPLICYDLRFPELFRAAVRRGADLFVVIASWPVMRDRHWQVLLQARAIENQAYVIGVNRCGRDPQFYYSGRSEVVDPQGVVIADIGEREGVFSSRIDPEIVAEWRRDFPAVRDMGWVDPAG